MGQAKMKFLTARQNSTGYVEMIIACATGTRRSVAAAALLQQVLETMEGYRTLPVVHISKIDWLQTCSSECAECANAEDIGRNIAMNHAELTWALSWPAIENERFGEEAREIVPETERVRKSLANKKRLRKESAQREIIRAKSNLPSNDLLITYVKKM